MPSFSFRHIKDLYPMMWLKSLLGIDFLKNEINDQNSGPDKNQGRVEVIRWTSRITLDIIGIAGLGREINSVKNSDDPLVKSYDELLEPDLRRLVHFVLSTIFGYSITKRVPWEVNYTFQRIAHSLQSISRDLVQEKRKAVEKATGEHFDILGLLIKSNDFSDESLADQVLTFLAAG